MHMMIKIKAEEFYLSFNVVVSQIMESPKMAVRKSSSLSKAERIQVSRLLLPQVDASCFILLSDTKQLIDFNEVIKKGDFVLSQTPAIMKLLGKEFGYYPDDARDEAHADSMMAFVTDFVAEGRLVFHSKKFTAGYAEQAEDVKPTVAWFESERLHQFLSYLEKVLKYNANLHAGGFAIGQKLTYVDIAIFHAVDAAENQFAAKFAEIRSEFPHVTAHKSMVASLPNIAAYLASDRRGSFAGDSMM